MAVIGQLSLTGSQELKIGLLVKAHTSSYRGCRDQSFMTFVLGREIFQLLLAVKVLIKFVDLH